MEEIIGVMGPGLDDVQAGELKMAYDVGRIVAQRGSVLLCGGMSGVMEACAKGAKAEGGITVGIGPTMDKNDMNHHIDIALPTGLNAGRNFLNVVASDMLIFVGLGSAGTLSEFAHAVQLDKPTVVICTRDEDEKFSANYGKSANFIPGITSLQVFLSRIAVK